MGARTSFILEVVELPLLLLLMFMLILLLELFVVVAVVVFVVGAFVVFACGIAAELSPFGWMYCPRKDDCA